jgi:3-deoxy-D-manno-octulosonic acid kinase
VAEDARPDRAASVRRANAAPSRGFIRVVDGAVVAVARPELVPALRQRGLLEPGRFERELEHAGGRHGRAGAAVLALEGVEERLLLRRVLHGGILAPLWCGTIAGIGRAVAELETTEALHAAGAPVPRPAAAIGHRIFGPFCRVALATYLEEDAIDALAFLDRRPDPARIEAAAAALGVAVRRFHDAGGRHADLHVKNLLVRERATDIEARVIDLDRARVQDGVTPAQRMRELMRLYRSLRKRDVLRVVGTRGCARFFHAYLDGDRALRRAMLARIRRERLRLALHALAYRR